MSRVRTLAVLYLCLITFLSHSPNAVLHMVEIYAIVVVLFELMTENGVRKILLFVEYRFLVAS